MAGTKAGAAKRIAAMIALHGSEEAYLEIMAKNGSKGGSVPRIRPFAQNRELARRAGKVGGTVSRRGPEKLTVSERRKLKQAIKIDLGEEL